MSETFLDINGYEGLYKVSNLGNIWCLNKNIKTLGYKKNNSKYFRICLSNKKIKKWFFVHRLILETFKKKDGYKQNKLDINHKDGNTYNNKLDNLEWCTRSENMLHAFKTGLITHVGELHNRSKLKTKDVLEIKKLISSGEKRKDIAKKYNISLASIHDIALKRTWGHLENTDTRYI